MIIAWRHFNDELDLEGKSDRSDIGLNKVDFLGQTSARSYEEGQRIPGDYEAQVGQEVWTREPVHARAHTQKEHVGEELPARPLPA